MSVVPLVEVQSSRTQRPSTGTSYPYVDLTLGDMNTQRVVQLQLEQVSHKCCTISFSGVQWSMCVLVRRAWSCVESSPCRWKTWCRREIKDSPCHPVKSPCYNTYLCSTVQTLMEKNVSCVSVTNTFSLPLLMFKCAWNTHIQSIDKPPFFPPIFRFRSEESP